MKDKKMVEELMRFIGANLGMKLAIEEKDGEVRVLVGKGKSQLCSAYMEQKKLYPWLNGFSMGVLCKV